MAALVTMVVGCTGGHMGPFDGPGLGGGDGASSEDDGADATEGADSVDETSGGAEAEPDDCGGPGQPVCDCTATDDEGQPLLGPCHPGCQDTYWRWSMWTTSYNVSGTLGYGEHQGNGLIGYAYRYDPRFGPEDGVERPWRTPSDELWTMGDGSSEADQFALRTLNPGAEVYVEPLVLPTDEDDLWPGETLPLVPMSVQHPVIDAAALCEAPQSILDVRHYNHGRTLAESVPNHAWDGFFGARDLIPMQLLEVIELTHTADGQWSSPSLTAIDEAIPQAVDTCLAGIPDGFCDARCGNCSYVMPTGFSGGAFAATEPGYQISGIPSDSAAPYTVGDGGPVAGRANWSAPEDGHQVWYVGGSVWGRAEDLAGYQSYDDWPDPDGVTPLPPGDAWMSMAGIDYQGDGIPDDWTDPFTHCVDPADGAGSQRPAGLPRFISGRWGHNSNSDAEASLRQFLGCAQDPVAAAEDAWAGTFACDACGVPRVETGALVQFPCRDLTHTATSFWDANPGAHDVDDLGPGMFDAVGLPRTSTDSWAALPKPVCRTSAQPVFGM